LYIAATATALLMKRCLKPWPGSDGYVHSAEKWK